MDHGSASLKLARALHPMKHPKTPETRAAEVAHLDAQLAGLGMPEECLNPVRALLRDFGTTGQGFSGALKVEGTPLVFQCLLSAQAHITSTIRVTSSAPPRRRS